MAGPAIAATHRIIETSVGGVLAYHADCSACSWESRRFDLEDAAVRAAQKHGKAQHAGGAK